MVNDPHKLKNIPSFTFLVYDVAVRNTPLLITHISNTSL